MFNIFKSRDARRKQLAREIAEARAAMREADTALKLVADLEKTLPGKIEAIRATPTLVHVGPAYATPEDAIDAREELRRECRTVEALEALRADLPAIKRFWTDRRAALAA